MKIQLTAPVIKVTSPTMIEIRDTGNAYMRAAFMLGDAISVQLNEPRTGSVTHTVENLSSGSYKASFVVAATNQPMGPAYDTVLRINGQVIAHAKGSLTSFTEADFVNFTIQV